MLRASYILLDLMFNIGHRYSGFFVLGTAGIKLSDLIVSGKRNDLIIFDNFVLPLIGISYARTHVISILNTINQVSLL